MPGSSPWRSPPNPSGGMPEDKLLSTGSRWFWHRPELRTFERKSKTSKGGVEEMGWKWAGGTEGSRFYSFSPTVPTIQLGCIFPTSGSSDCEAQLLSVAINHNVKYLRHGGLVFWSCFSLQVRLLHVFVHGVYCRTPAWRGDLTCAPHGRLPAGAGLLRPE